VRQVNAPDNQTGANCLPAEELASTSNTVGHPSFGSAVSRASAADLSRSSEGFAAQESTNAACIGLRARAGQVGPGHLGSLPKSAEVSPDACRAASERRHVDPDDRPLTQPALLRRLSAPMILPPIRSPRAAQAKEEDRDDRVGDRNGGGNGQSHGLTVHEAEEGEHRARQSES
jgi:hypothetical protein